MNARYIADVECTGCDGTGNDDQGNICRDCRGVGTVEALVDNNPMEATSE